VLGGFGEEDRAAVLEGLANEVMPRIVDEIRAANAHAVSEDALQAVLNVTAGDITARFDELLIEVLSHPIRV